MMIEAVREEGCFSGGNNCCGNDILINNYFAIT